MDVFSREELLEVVASGARPKYVFFWGHTKKSPNAPLGHECFSQWFPADFSVDGVAYPSAEHFMMAEKARLFGDDDALERILVAGSPGAAKAIGREVRGFDPRVWETERFDIVRRGSAAKFGQDPELNAYLLGTGARVLVEASPRDRIWGIGMGKSNPDAENPEKWRGLNLLGFALMAARADLRDAA